MALNDIISDIVLDAAMQPDYNPREKMLRDKFVKEYLEDYNPIQAAMRCGFMRSFAEEYAEKFMNEPYVQEQINILQYQETKTQAEQLDEIQYNRKRIVNGLFKEAHFHGAGASHSARVAAFSKLASMFDLDSPVKTENTIKVLPAEGLKTLPLSQKKAMVQLIDMIKRGGGEVEDVEINET